MLKVLILSTDLKEVSVNAALGRLNKYDETLLLGRKELEYNRRWKQLRHFINKNTCFQTSLS